MYDTWDLVFRNMAKEKRIGKCHTHIYKSILTPEKMLHYCYMNRRVLNGLCACPTYEEAEAMLDFLAGHGYELQYAMADGHLYRYDWNSSSDLEEREEYSLEDAALFCRDMAGASDAQSYLSHFPLSEAAHICNQIHNREVFLKHWLQER